MGVTRDGMFGRFGHVPCVTVCCGDSGVAGTRSALWLCAYSVQAQVACTPCAGQQCNVRLASAPALQGSSTRGRMCVWYQSRFFVHKTCGRACTPLAPSGFTFLSCFTDSYPWTYT